MPAGSCSTCGRWLGTTNLEKHRQGQCPAKIREAARRLDSAPIDRYNRVMYDPVTDTILAGPKKLAKSKKSR